MSPTEASTVAYPEPIPVLRGKDAKEFLRRLEAFKLTESQKQFYRSCRELYRKLAPK